MDKNFQPVTGPVRSPMVKRAAATCSCAPADDNSSAFSQAFVTGRLKSGARIIPVISTLLTWRDRWNHFKARTSSFRNNYAVQPGLYAAGNPGAESDVFVTANYGMSFNYLRQALHAMNAWILVLDTKGINVWCAAGKGTFGTTELVSRIKNCGLQGIISGRRIIVPQLGAPGVDAAEVQRQTGFRVVYGPVRANDIMKFVEAGYRATGDMRRVKFGFTDRLVLVPMEVIPAMKKYPQFFIILFILFGLTTEGIIFKKAFTEGLPFYLGGIAAVLTGALITPLLLPIVPFRSFAMKGLVTGLAMFIPLAFRLDFAGMENLLLRISFILLFTAVSSYLAVQFTGATTFTHISGVKRELKFALPVYIVTAVISFVLIICHKAGIVI